MADIQQLRQYAKRMETELSASRSELTRAEEEMRYSETTISEQRRQITVLCSALTDATTASADTVSNMQLAVYRFRDAHRAAHDDSQLYGLIKDVELYVERLNESTLSIQRRLSNEQVEVSTTETYAERPGGTPSPFASKLGSSRAFADSSRSQAPGLGMSAVSGTGPELESELRRMRGQVLDLQKQSESDAARAASSHQNNMGTLAMTLKVDYQREIAAVTARAEAARADADASAARATELLSALSSAQSELTRVRSEAEEAVQRAAAQVERTKAEAAVQVERLVAESKAAIESTLASATAAMESAEACRASAEAERDAALARADTLSQALQASLDRDKEREAREAQEAGHVSGGSRTRPLSPGGRMLVTTVVSTSHPSALRTPAQAPVRPQSPKQVDLPPSHIPEMAQMRSTLDAISGHLSVLRNSHLSMPLSPTVEPSRSTLELPMSPGADVNSSFMYGRGQGLASPLPAALPPRAPRSSDLLSSYVPYGALVTTTSGTGNDLRGSAMGGEEVRKTLAAALGRAEATSVAMLEVQKALGDAEQRLIAEAARADDAEEEADRARAPFGVAQAQIATLKGELQAAEDLAASLGKQLETERDKGTMGAAKILVLQSELAAAGLVAEEHKALVEGLQADVHSLTESMTAASADAAEQRARAEEALLSVESAKRAALVSEASAAGQRALAEAAADKMGLLRKDVDESKAALAAEEQVLRAAQAAVVLSDEKSRAAEVAKVEAQHALAAAEANAAERIAIASARVRAVEDELDGFKALLAAVELQVSASEQLKARCSAVQRELNTVVDQADALRAENAVLSEALQAARTSLAMAEAGAASFHLTPDAAFIVSRAAALEAELASALAAADHANALRVRAEASASASDEAFIRVRAQLERVSATVAGMTQQVQDQFGPFEHQNTLGGGGTEKEEEEDIETPADIMESLDAAAAEVAATDAAADLAFAGDDDLDLAEEEAEDAMGTNNLQDLHGQLASAKAALVAARVQLEAETAARSALESDLASACAERAALLARLDSTATTAHKTAAAALMHADKCLTAEQAVAAGRAALLTTQRQLIALQEDVAQLGRDAVKTRLQQLAARPAPALEQVGPSAATHLVFSALEPGSAAACDAATAAFETAKAQAAELQVALAASRVETGRTRAELEGARAEIGATKAALEAGLASAGAARRDAATSAAATLVSSSAREALAMRVQDLESSLLAIPVLEEEVAALQEARTSLQKDLAAVRGAADMLDSDVDSLRQSRDALGRELSSVLQIRDAACDERDSAHMEMTEALLSLEESEAALSAARADLDGFIDVQSEMEIERGEMQGVIAGLQANIESLKKLVAAGSLSSREAEYSRVERGVAEDKVKLATKKARLHALEDALLATKVKAGEAREAATRAAKAADESEALAELAAGKLARHGRGAMPSGGPDRLRAEADASASSAAAAHAAEASVRADAEATGAEAELAALRTAWEAASNEVAEYEAQLLDSQDCLALLPSPIPGLAVQVTAARMALKMQHGVLQGRRDKEVAAARVRLATKKAGLAALDQAVASAELRMSAATAALEATTHAADEAEARAEASAGKAARRRANVRDREAAEAEAKASGEEAEVTAQAQARASASWSAATAELEAVHISASAAAAEVETLELELAGVEGKAPADFASPTRPVLEQGEKSSGIADGGAVLFSSDSFTAMPALPSSSMRTGFGFASAVSIASMAHTRGGTLLQKARDTLAAKKVRAKALAGAAADAVRKAQAAREAAESAAVQADAAPSSVTVKLADVAEHSARADAEAAETAIVAADSAQDEVVAAQQEVATLESAAPAESAPSRAPSTREAEGVLAAFASSANTMRQQSHSVLQHATQNLTVKKARAKTLASAAADSVRKAQAARAAAEAAPPHHTEIAERAAAQHEGIAQDAINAADAAHEELAAAQEHVSSIEALVAEVADPPPAMSATVSAGRGRFTSMVSLAGMAHTRGGGLLQKARDTLAAKKVRAKALAGAAADAVCKAQAAREAAETAKQAVEEVREISPADTKAVAQAEATAAKLDLQADAHELSGQEAVADAKLAEAEVRAAQAMVSDLVSEATSGESSAQEASLAAAPTMASPSRAVVQAEVEALRAELARTQVEQSNSRRALQDSYKMLAEAEASQKMAEEYLSKAANRAGQDGARDAGAGVVDGTLSAASAADTASLAESFAHIVALETRIGDLEATLATARTEIAMLRADADAARAETALSKSRIAELSRPPVLLDAGTSTGAQSDAPSADDGLLSLAAGGKASKVRRAGDVDVSYASEVEADALRSRVAQLEADLTGASSALDRTRSADDARVAILQSNIDKLVKEVERLSEARMTAERDGREAIAAVDSLQRELASLKAIYSDTERTMQGLQATATAGSAETTSLRAERDRLAMELTVARGQLGQALTGSGAVGSKLASSTVLHASTLDKLTATESALRESRRDVARLQEALELAKAGASGLGYSRSSDPSVQLAALTRELDIVRRSESELKRALSASVDAVEDAKAAKLAAEAALNKVCADAAELLSQALGLRVAPDQIRRNKFPAHVLEAVAQAADGVAEGVKARGTGRPGEDAASALALAECQAALRAANTRKSDMARELAQLYRTVEVLEEGMAKRGRVTPAGRGKGREQEEEEEEEEEDEAPRRPVVSSAVASALRSTFRSASASSASRPRH